MIHVHFSLVKCIVLTTLAVCRDVLSLHVELRDKSCSSAPLLIHERDVNIEKRKTEKEKERFHDFLAIVDCYIILFGKGNKCVQKSALRLEKILSFDFNVVECRY